MNIASDYQPLGLDLIKSSQDELDNIRAHPYLSIPKFLKNLDSKEVPQPLIKMSQLHVDMHKHIEENDWSLIVMPRGFAKTQHIPIGYALARIGMNQNIRIKIGCETLDVAGERSAAVKSHIEKNEEYKTIYPNVSPSADNWGKESLTVIRDSSATDATVTAYGSQTGITGGRADLYIFDDFCGERVTREKVRRETGKEVFWNAVNLLTKESKLIYIGTPFHFDDLTKNLMDGAPDNGFALFFRPVVEKDGKIISPWSEYWSSEELKKKRDKFYFNGKQGEWFKGYLCEPMADEEADFDKNDIDNSVMISNDPVEDLKIDDTWIKLVSVDQAYTKKTRSDYTVIIYGVVNPETLMRVPLVIIRKKLLPKELAREIINVYDVWHPSKIGVENVSSSGDTLKSLIETTEPERMFPIEPIYPIGDKAQRHSRLSASISAKRIKIPTHQHPMKSGSQPCNCGKCSLIKEMYMSPNSKKDDCMDGLELLDRMAEAETKTSELVIDWM